jgi:hypothetical protein
VAWAQLRADAAEFTTWLGSTWVGEVGKGIAGAAMAVGDGFKAVWEGAKLQFNDFSDWIKDTWVGTALDSAIQAIKGKFSEIWGIIKADLERHGLAGSATPEEMKAAASGLSTEGAVPSFYGPSAPRVDLHLHRVPEGVTAEPTPGVTVTDHPARGRTLDRH